MEPPNAYKASDKRRKIMHKKPGHLIPKKIHYCWLSGDKMPGDALRCIETWKNKLSGYEFVLWDKNKFDINSVDFVREACDVKRWAFAADYIRLYAIYSEGGIYLDTDVYIKKSFDGFLGNSFFTAVEYQKNYVERENVHELLNEDGKLNQPPPPPTHKGQYLYAGNRNTGRCFRRNKGTSVSEIMYGQI
jgi:hypothetical protein